VQPCGLYCETAPAAGFSKPGNSPVNTCTSPLLAVENSSDKKIELNEHAQTIISYIMR
jgi:hypothetical protein